MVKSVQNKTLLLFLALLLYTKTCCDALDLVENCIEQRTNVQKQLLNQTVKDHFFSQFVFVNESKPTLLMTWGAQHTLIVVTLRIQGVITREADVYRSTNDGKNFEKITDKIDTSGKLLVMQNNGLQRNPIDPQQIYLVSYDSTFTKSIIYYTPDSGASWKQFSLDFQIQSAFQFHQTNTKDLLVQSGSNAYASTNNGESWIHLHDKVFKVSWGVGNDSTSAVYAAVEMPGSGSYDVSGFLASLMQGSQQLKRKPGRQLIKSDNFRDWRSLSDSIYSYSNKGNFVFVSKADSDNTDLRHLEVSTNYGKTFVRTQLPSVTPDRFFAILDMDEGVAFVHMDGGNYQGFGTLYTSDESGEVFSKSLDRHFYPPIGSGSDFYRVESMRGTYVTTVLHSDKSMHSVITHNRGAVWESLGKPEGITCPTKNPCNLQIASQYSISRGVPAEAPLSTQSAAGLVVAHGHAAANLQSNGSDVFVSSDGGYSWRKALSGPHHVQIGNNGNFLVAIELGVTSPKEVKFSTDAGRCWHVYNFTTENYTFTALLTEPGNRALTVTIWGFVGKSRQWRAFIVDLRQLLTRECNEADYESWLTNGEIKNSSESASHRACLFGAKQTIKRLKPDSMCFSDYTYTPVTNSAPCECTKEDYECEFGFSRKFDDKECIRENNDKVPEICEDNKVYRIESVGYRLLPRNRCQGGFQPNKTKKILIRQGCPQPEEDSRVRDGKKLMASLEKQRLEAEEAKTRRTIGLIAPLSITVAILLGVVLTLVILARLRERRRRQLAFHYSVVSATGRRADDLEYQPADGILNGTGPRRAAYSATSATVSGAGGNKKAHRAGDKQQLLDRADDEDLIS